MKCPYCNKKINGSTGLQELQSFKQHLGSCKNNPDRMVMVDENGNIYVWVKPISLNEALEIRAKNGQ